MRRCSLAAFTFVELLVASLIFGGVAIALAAFSSTSIRLISRNLATNHTHEAARVSVLQMLHDLHDAASPFRLVTFNGTTYTDATATVTTDLDPLTQKFVSTRANGVRFRKLAGGPYKLTANTTPSSTNLTCQFEVNGSLPYIPQVGDKVVVPLISREYSISAVPTAPTTGSTQGTVTISSTTGIGFTIDATTAENSTTAYFYREVAYSVFDRQLRYHSNFTSTNKSAFKVIRNHITSPSPFALLFPTSTSQVDNLALRASLEIYDSAYTARSFRNGTATLQTVIPPLSVPTPVSATDSI